MHTDEKRKKDCISIAQWRIKQILNIPFTKDFSFHKFPQD